MHNLVTVCFFLVGGEMRGFLSLAIFSSLFCSMVFPVLAQGLRVDLDGGVLDLGQGFDTAINEPRGFCVDSTSSLSELMKDGPASTDSSQIDPAQRVTYSLRLLDTEEFLREFESLSVSASGSYASFSASGSYSTEREFERTEHNLFVVLTVDVSIQIIGGDIHSIPEALVGDTDTGGTNLNSRRCGDAFVAAVGLGGRLDLIARINTLSQTERESLRASLSGGGNFGAVGVEASASFTRIVETALQRRDANIEIQTAGPWFGDDAFNLDLTPDFDISRIQDLQRLVNAAMSFPDAVADRPWPYVGYLLNYETIGYNAPNPVLQSLNRNRFRELELALDRYALAIDRITAARENPDIFEAIDNDGAVLSVTDLDVVFRRELERLFASREEIRKATEECYQILLDGTASCPSIATISADSFPVDAVPNFSFGSLKLIIESREAELCDEESSFVFLRLVPVDGGCVDPETSLVWSNPRFLVEADIGEYFCDQRSTGSGRTWRLPTELELRFLASGTELARLARVRSDSAVNRLLAGGDEVDSPADAESEVWVWARETADGEVTRIVNLASRVSTGADPDTGLYTAICVASLTEISDAAVNDADAADGD
ncbi:hypothetical protein [Jannaschia sp. AI_61]|nr:hypothetical protein [Jannaschia sp. AI_61]